MKYASERGVSTSVHDWKPCPADRFTKLIHHYTTRYGCEYGHGGLTMTAMKLDETATCTIFYYPQNGSVGSSVRSPVLMTMTMAEDKIVCFESVKYGIDAPHPRGKMKISADGVRVYNANEQLVASMGIK